MIVIAVLLMAAAAALTVGVLLASTEPTQLDVYVASVDSTVSGVFLTGLATGAAFLLGLVLFRAALKRGRRRRHERRALMAEHQRTVASLEEEKQEKERLRERLSPTAPEAPDAQHPSHRAP